MKITYGDNIYYIKNGFDVFMPNNETIVDASLDNIENGWLTIYETFSCKKCHKPITAEHHFNVAKNYIVHESLDECICNSCWHPQYHLFSVVVVTI